MTQINRPNFGYPSGVNKLDGMKKSDIGSMVGAKDVSGKTEVKEVVIPQEMFAKEQIQAKIDELVAYAASTNDDMNLTTLHSMVSDLMSKVQNYSEMTYEDDGKICFRIEFEFGGQRYLINGTYKGQVSNPSPSAGGITPGGEPNGSGKDHTPQTSVDPSDSDGSDDTSSHPRWAKGLDSGLETDTEDPRSVAINNLLSWCREGSSTGLNEIRAYLDYYLTLDYIDSYSMSVENGVATITFKFVGEEFKLSFNEDNIANGVSREMY